MIQTLMFLGGLLLGPRSEKQVQDTWATRHEYTESRLDRLFSLKSCQLVVTFYCMGLLPCYEEVHQATLFSFLKFVTHSKTVCLLRSGIYNMWPNCSRCFLVESASAVECFPTPEDDIRPAGFLHQNHLTPFPKTLYFWLAANWLTCFQQIEGAIIILKINMEHYKFLEYKIIQKIISKHWSVNFPFQVLRPGVLWFLRNLNDPDFNPVQEMIHLPIYRHLRRFILSVVKLHFQFLCSVNFLIVTNNCSFRFFL